MASEAPAASADAMNCESSGNGFRRSYDSPVDSVPRNFWIDPGEKTPEEVAIEKAENEKKYQMFDKNGVRINLFFDHGKYSKTPSADVTKKGKSVSSRTDYAIIADLRYGKMCLFAYKGKQGKRKLVKAAPCSSAANIPGTKTTRTPAGQHRISWKTDRLVYTNKEGKKWQYWSCSMTSGGRGIHSLTYHMSARYRYDRVYLLGGKLGAHNSPACIRTENWMADWVYKHCPNGTTLYVIR